MHVSWHLFKLFLGVFPGFFFSKHFFHVVPINLIALFPFAIGAHSKRCASTRGRVLVESWGNPLYAAGCPCAGWALRLEVIMIIMIVMIIVILMEQPSHSSNTKRRNENGIKSTIRLLLLMMMFIPMFGRSKFDRYSLHSFFNPCLNFSGCRWWRRRRRSGEEWDTFTSVMWGQLRVVTQRIGNSQDQDKIFRW